MIDIKIGGVAHNTEKIVATMEEHLSEEEFSRLQAIVNDPMTMLLLGSRCATRVEFSDVDDLVGWIRKNMEGL